MDQIIDILSKNDVKATFFIVGDWITKYPDYIKKLDASGHEIGNHSTTHPHYTQLSPQKMKEEIFITSSRLKLITGKETNLFRPPYGDYNSQVVKSVTEAGHYCIQWDVDSLDWTNPGEEFIFERVVSKTGNGSIILFHNNPSETAHVLDRTIKELKKKGFKFVIVSELIYKENYYIDHTGRQRTIE
jgi:polysaccharide deacetylase family sporulation protein PdaB